jgi:hypothetical protein
MWRDSITGTVVTWHGGIKELRPNISMPNILSDELISELGFEVVKQVPPNNTYLEKATALPPVKLNDVWVQQWKIDPVSEQEAIILKNEYHQQIKNSCINRTQTRLDQFAQARGYDSILSACTYATSSSSKFAMEGQYCINVRDATWSKLLEILSEVESNVRPVPKNYEEIEPELPQLVWPS